jgi:phosphate uptake regulator
MYFIFIMRRKVIRQGHNTLTVSLPIKWAKAHNLKEGEEIDLNEKGANLIISKEAYRGGGTINVDITGMHRNSIIMLLESFYNYGYDVINITSKDTKVKWILYDEDWQISKIVNYSANLMVGAELVKSEKGNYIIEVLTEDSKEKFDLTLRRLFRLIIGIQEGYLEGLKKKQKGMLEEKELQHFNIMKFINYALRLLNKFGYEEAHKTTYYFSLITLLSKVERISKNITDYTFKYLKISEKSIGLIKEIFDGFKEYYDVFYKYDLKKISEIIAKRDRFRYKFFNEEYKNLSKDEILLVSYMSHVYEVILDLIEIKMAIEK